MAIKRIYHPYHKWEEYKYGMWKTINGKERERLLKLAIEFTGNAEIYGEWMQRVIHEWPISCEHNLSCENINRQAWIGHAATCLAIDCPEDITRTAWHYLTPTQQEEANVRADQAILKWSKEFQEKIQCLNEDLEQMSLPLHKKE